MKWIFWSGLLAVVATACVTEDTSLDPADYRCCAVADPLPSLLHGCRSAVEPLPPRCRPRCRAAAAGRAAAGLLMRALTRDPEDRFQNAGQFLAPLLAWARRDPRFQDGIMLDLAAADGLQPTRAPAEDPDEQTTSRHGPSERRPPASSQDARPGSEECG